MNALVFLAATAALGVDVGWQPLDGGGFEYIIQIPPDQVASLTDGFEITSDVPPLYRGLRTYRIIVGSGPLPRVGAPPLPVSKPAHEEPDDTNVDAPAPTADSTPPPELPDTATLNADAIAGQSPDVGQPQEHSTGYVNQKGAVEPG